MNQGILVQNDACGTEGEGVGREAQINAWDARFRDSGRAQGAAARAGLRGPARPACCRHSWEGFPCLAAGCNGCCPPLPGLSTKSGSNSSLSSHISSVALVPARGRGGQGEGAVQG